jgi:molybdopterin molybdotransferase
MNISPYPMLSPDEALGLVLAQVQPLAAQLVPLAEAVGLVLAEDVDASLDVPPFPTATMDGYAVRAAEGAAARVVLGEQDAGHIAAPEVAAGTAVRIMTGAALPAGADAVIPVEEATEEQGRVCFSVTVAAGANVRQVGRDLRQGERVLSAGGLLSAPEIGLLATLGHAEVRVIPRPRVAIMATGDELVPLGAPLGAGQIRDANSHALAAWVRQMGAQPVSLGIIRDEEVLLRGAIAEGLRRADILLTTGGVSMGRRDLVKPLLAALGTVHFGRVRQKPGKPTTFATLQGQPVFGLPGFPVSSLVSAELYVRPALRRLAGWRAVQRPQVLVRLEHALRHDAERLEFQRAVVTWRDGVAWARNTGDQVSSRLGSLVGANALLRLDPALGDLAAGATVLALLTDRAEGM